MSTDRLDRRVAAVARVLARGALRPEWAARYANVIRLYDLGDREGARALLEGWHLMPGQPIGSPSFSAEKVA